MKHGYEDREYRVAFDWCPVSTIVFILQSRCSDGSWRDLTKTVRTNMTSPVAATALNRAGAFIIERVRSAADSTCKLPDMAAVGAELRMADARYIGS